MNIFNLNPFNLIKHAYFKQEQTSDNIQQNGETQLTQAIIDNKIDLVKKLLLKGASPNQTNQKNQSPLFVALENENIEIIKLLLNQSQIDVDQKNQCDELPIHIIAKKNREDIIDLLLAKKANINSADRDGKTALGYAFLNKNTKLIKKLLDHDAQINSYEMEEAIKTGQLPTIKLFIQKDPRFLHEIDGLKNSILHTAILSDQTEIAKYLISLGMDPYLLNQNGHSPLSLAVNKNNLEFTEYSLTHHKVNIPYNKALLFYALDQNKLDFVKLFIEKGGVSANISDQHGYTLLHRAVSLRNSDLVDFLLNNHADAKIQSKGLNPLQIALAHPQLDIENLKIIESLLKSDPNLISFQNATGKALLHIAADGGVKEYIDLLLAVGCNINQKDKYNLTPLHSAIYSKKFDAAKYLVSKGSDLKAVDNSSFTPLHLTAIYGNPDIVEFLLKQGDPNATTKDDKTPLHLAVEIGHIDIIEAFTKHAPPITNWNAKDKEGFTPFHRAIDKGNLIIAAHFLSQSDLNTKNAKGYTPLHTAIQNFDFDAAKFLITHGADVNLKSGDTNGYSPLHFAVSTGSVKIVEFLLKNHGDLNAVDKENKTPVHLAVEKCRQGAVEFFIKQAPTTTLWNAKDKEGFTPFHRAINKGYLGIASLLFSLSDINSKDNQGLAAIHTAILNDNFQMLKFLIDSGVDPNSMSDSSIKGTPLHFAVSKSNPIFSDYLLKNKADPSIDSSDQYNSLCYAVWCNQLDSVKLILNSDPSLVDRINSTGDDTPLCNCKDKKMVEYLIQKGANPDRIIKKDNEILTPAWLAFFKTNYVLSQVIMEQEKLSITHMINIMKLLNHRFGLGITIVFKDQSLKLKGLSEFITYNEMAKSIKHTTSWISKAPSGWSTIDSAAIHDVIEKGISLQIKNNHPNELTKKIMENYQKGEVIAIPFSMLTKKDSKHGVSVLIYKDILIKCNRWDPNSGLEIFKINDPSKIEQAVNHLYLFNGDEKNKDFFFKDIDKMLNLQPIKLIRHVPQKTGNCTWTNSAKQSLHGTLYLYLIKKGYNEKDAEKHSETMYKAWVQEDKVNAIQSFATEMPLFKEILFYPIYDHVATKDQTTETQEILSLIEKIEPTAATKAKEEELNRKNKPRSPKGKIYETIRYNVTYNETFSKSVEIFNNSKKSNNNLNSKPTNPTTNP